MVPFPPVVSGILSGIQLLRNAGNDNQTLDAEIKSSLRSLSLEISMAQWDITKYAGEAEELTLWMQELLCDIEDFICNLNIPGKAAAFFANAVGLDPRPGGIVRIEHFKESIKSIQARLPAPVSSAPPPPPPPPPPPSWSSSSRSRRLYTPEGDLVGFHETKAEFLKLLSPADVHLMRVISIVGCSGVGKTALARAVYESATAVQPLTPPATIQVDCKAWVVASLCKDAEDLQSQVRQQVDNKYKTTTAGDNTTETLRDFLLDKRYLVFVDDVQPQGVRWEDIKDAFPHNEKGSRIIVTTSFHSIARVCSSGRYYVHPMKCLSREHSKELFWRKVYGGRHSKWTPSSEDNRRLQSILDKCGDLPLAIIGAAKYISDKGEHGLTEDRSKDLCRTLGTYLQQSDRRNFDELKRTFVGCYDRLTQDDVDKNCLLYVSIFPYGHEISSRSLARRLIAEELVTTVKSTEEKMAAVRQWLEKLTDRSMVEPVVNIRNNSERPQRCQVHGAMLEFTIQKSLSRNLVTLIDKGKERHSNHGRVRRLTVQSSSKLQCDDILQEDVEYSHLLKQSKLSSVRSLTTFSSGIPDFKSCKMMRVLDLEGCTSELNDKQVVRDICELVFLRYLSLRKTGIKELPEELKKLKYLETLDIRDTPMAISLPLVAIMLPEIAYLLGKFEVSPPSNPTETWKLMEFLRRKSKIRALAGIVIDESETDEVLEAVVQHARTLKKVKIWCKDTPSPGSSTHPASIATSAAIENTPASPAPVADAAIIANIHPPVTPVDLDTTTPLISAPAPRKTIAFPTWRGFKRLLGAPFRSTRPTRRRSQLPKPNLAVGNCNIEPLNLIEPFMYPLGSQHNGSTFVPLPPPPSDHSVATTSRLAGILVSSPYLHSLSIESSGGFCNVFLDSMKAPCNISSIKLRGGLAGLPGSATLKHLRSLNKLHLFSTGLSSNVLSALQSLPSLEYLKLAEDRDGCWNDSFIVEGEGFPEGPGFPCLKELCFEGPKHPPVQIKFGGMKHLTSLKLLCKGSPDLSADAICRLGVEEISHLTKLNEVILHGSADVATVEAWKEAAKKHINMPCVKKQPTA